MGSEVTFDGLVESVRRARLPSPNVRRDIREVAGVSIREAAKAMGVAPMTLLRWERGTVQPTREHAVAYRGLLDALNEAAS